MKFKNFFLLVAINIALTIALFVCLCYIVKQNKVIKSTIEIIDEMTIKVKEDFCNDFQYFEMRKSFIQDDIDSFYLKKNENIENMKKYCNSSIGQHAEIESLLNAMQGKLPQSMSYELLSKMLEYQFITNIIKNRCTSFFWLDDTGVKVISKQDTINLGEEYISEFVLTGHIFNKKQNPVVVIDNDTLMVYNNFFDGCYKFTERPKGKGVIKHKGYMTTFHPTLGVTQLPIVFEYYVK